jgi:hypothetical protein
VRHIPDTERRARLARRHALAIGHRAADPEAATRAVTVLHSTEPATVYLSVWARVDGVTVGDVDRALYEDRSLVKQLAMRRTLFVFPRDLLPAAWGSAAARVAEQQEARLVKEVEAAGHAEDGAAWLAEARARVVDVLAGKAMTAQEIRKAVPALEARLDLAPGKKYAANVSMAPRVLTQLGVEGTIVRGENAGHWRISKPRWALMTDWLGDVPPPAKADEGYAELVGRWLRSFGPGTEDDLVWWLGATKGAVRGALASLGAVEVSLNGGRTGWVLPDDPSLDTGRADEVEPWAALLPVLDPTVMGWKERGFYLGEHGPQLFDGNGNAGTTAWWDGWVVGCWVQDDDGVVEVRLLEKVPAQGKKALAAEAERLTAWLGGVRIGTVYPSAAMKVVDWVHP